MANLMEGKINTSQMIKNNINKQYANKNSKENNECKDNMIEIVVENKNVTPKPIYFNFQETEEKKDFDKIDNMLKHFDKQKRKEDEQKRLDKEIKKERDITELKKDDLFMLKKTKYTDISSLAKPIKERPTKGKYKTESIISEKYHEIILIETETINLLNVPNLLYDTLEEKLKVEKKNERYKKLLNSSENKYRSKLMQTLNIFTKNKDVYVSTINKKNKETETNMYQLHKLVLLSSTPVYELLHKKFIKYRNKKMKNIMNEFGDSLSINEQIVLNKNQWFQVVDKNPTDTKHTSAIPKSFYKSRKTNTSMFNNLFSTKNLTRTVSNKSRTFRTKNKYKTIKSMKFLANSYSEDEYMIKTMIKRRKEESDKLEETNKEVETDTKLPWKINNKKKYINKESFLRLIRNLEKHIVQNIYFYEQVIYKGIDANLTYLKEQDKEQKNKQTNNEKENNKNNNKNNQVKIFDGENYDVITNPRLNYKKKKISFRFRVRNKSWKIINFSFRKTQRNKKGNRIGDKDKNKDKDENKNKGENNDKEITQCNEKQNDESSKCKVESDLSLTKGYVRNLPKKKKKKLKQKLAICKLKKNVANRVKKKRNNKDELISENTKMGKGIKEEEKKDKDEKEKIINENKNTKEEKKKQNELEPKCFEETTDTKKLEKNIIQIGDLILNEENNAEKLKKINTLIIDDVLQKNDDMEHLNAIGRSVNEKKKIKNKLNRKKTFVFTSNNRIQLKKIIKEKKTYKYEDINEIYKKETENNLINAKKRKEYIKNISIIKLFKFHYEKLANIVTSIDTNKFYSDYITASYANTTDIGSFQNCKGNIAIFNFINPSYPLQLFNLNTKVLKIKYAPNNPNLLVSILSNGQVYIYDLRNKDKEAIFKSTTIKNYYENSFEPIYDLSFKHNSNFSLPSLSNSTNSLSAKKNDVFYTVHENGYVHEWHLGKELKNKEILFLKNKHNILYRELESIFQKRNFLEKSFNSSLTCIDIDNYINNDETFIMGNIQQKEATNTENNNIHEYEHEHTNEENKHIGIEKEKKKKHEAEKEKEREKECKIKIENKMASVNHIESFQNKKEAELMNHYKNITQDIIGKKIKPTHSYYYIGTKNGLIYRCNSCYNKSYLNYYVAHFGSVNKIKINKFDHDIFLSAGDDCTIKLWNRNHSKQITTFMSKNSFTPINDIMWLPNNSTSFFACTDDGRIELWDFDFFSKDPLIIFYPNNDALAKMKSLKIFHRNDILLSGDNMGNVFMMKINNLFNLDAYDYEQKNKLMECLKYLDTYEYF